jgi:hypothetical protein
MPVEPYALRSEPQRPDSIELSVRITNPGGGWIELNDHVTFTIADGSFASEGVTWRRKQDTNEFLEGTYLVNALRENVTRPLNVWVTGDTHYDLEVALEKLKDLVGQRAFQVVRTVENVSTLWDCQASDYVTESDRPLLHARMAQLKVQLVCHPVSSYAEEI